MHNLESMYKEYARAYAISNEVVNAFMMRGADVDEIVRAEQAAKKYYALSVLIWKTMKANRAQNQF